LTPDRALARMAETLDREVEKMKSLIRRHVSLFDPTMGPMKPSFCVGVAPRVNHGHLIISSEETAPQSQRPGCPVTQFGLTRLNPAVILTTKLSCLVLTLTFTVGSLCDLTTDFGTAY
jgi:hypothetical protein